MSPTEPAHRVRPSLLLALVGVVAATAWIYFQAPEYDGGPRPTPRRLLARIRPAAPATVQTAVGPITLPPPFASQSSVNPPLRMVPRPPGAALRVPAGFRIEPASAEPLHIRRMIDVEGGWLAVDARRSEVLFLADVPVGTPLGPGATVVRLREPAHGVALHPNGWLYVGLPSAIQRIRWDAAAHRASGNPEVVIPLPSGGGHITRDVIFTADGTRMLVAVGSASNNGMERDVRRAAVSEFAIDGTGFRIFASGLRNPVTLAREPFSGEHYVVVNERDGMGEDLVPDFFTRIRPGEFFGWPYAYFGQLPDPDHGGDPHPEVARAVVPDVSLGAHTAAVGLDFHTGTRVPVEYRGSALIALHGSWNRARRTGYSVVEVKFRDGRPVSAPRPLVTGWLLPDETVWGRPCMIHVARDGSIFIGDDGAGTLWRMWFDQALPTPAAAAHDPAP